MEKVAVINEAIIPKLSEMMQPGTSLPPDYEQIRAGWLNETPRDADGYDCPDCLNSRYIAYFKDGSIKTRDCKCVAYRKFLKNLKRSGLEDMADRCTFDLFKTSEKWQAVAKDMAKSFLKDDIGKWFCALGNPGSGKTHLCTAICLELLKTGKEVYYMRWRDEVVALNAAVNDGEKYQELIEPLKRVNVLYIDDFLKTDSRQKPTPGDMNRAFELITHRYNKRNGVTIISSELMIEDLLSIDQSMGSRICERSEGYRLELFGREKNLRLKGELS